MSIFAKIESAYVRAQEKAYKNSSQYKRLQEQIKNGTLVQPIMSAQIVNPFHRGAREYNPRRDGYCHPPKATVQKADPQPKQVTTPASPNAQPQPEIAKSTPQKVDAFEKQNNPAAAKTGA